MSLYIFLHPFYNRGQSVRFWRSDAVSLKRSQAATGFTATRGRRRLFLLLALLRLRLVRQEAGERLCSRNESHCQATSCGRKKKKKGGELVALTSLSHADVISISFIDDASCLHAIIFSEAQLLSYSSCLSLYMQKRGHKNNPGIIRDL